MLHEVWFKLFFEKRGHFVWIYLKVFQKEQRAVETIDDDSRNYRLCWKLEKTGVVTRRISEYS